MTQIFLSCKILSTLDIPPSSYIGSRFDNPFIKTVASQLYSFNEHDIEKDLQYST